MRSARRRPNILLITVDDMNHDVPGFAGGLAPGVTPHLDRLASQSLWFAHAHVASAICQPSRQSMMTGRYPHNIGAPGFDPIDPRVPTLQERLHEAGYVNGILGKVNHLAPEEKYQWSYRKEMNQLGMGRDPRLYHRYASEFIEQAKRAGQPFFLMANAHDPHRPFAGSDDEAANLQRPDWKANPYPTPDRVFQPGEVAVPGFLPDLPDVRRELAEYASSCRRADQTVGEVLRALAESGLESDTLVMFTTDHGMPLPFAKTNCYPASTRSPWLVRWPGVVEPGVDREHFICGVDFMPTILDAAGLAQPEGLDGRSFLPLLRGEKQADRDHVFTTINTLSSRKAYPMRGLHDHRFTYIFNAWADGKTRFQNESQRGRTWRAMTEAAKKDRAIAERVRLFQYRVPEELYDRERDPCCLTNLAADAGHRALLERMRRRMAETMQATRDPELDAFRAAT